MQELVPKVGDSLTNYREPMPGLLTVLRALLLSMKGFLSSSVLSLGLDIVFGIVEILTVRNRYSM